MQSQRTKFYKVVRRNADPFHIEQEKLEAILNDPNQLIKYYASGKEWRAFNKADIVDAFYDEEYTEKTNKIEFDSYFDTQTQKVVMLQSGTLPDDMERYKKL